MTAPAVRAARAFGETDVDASEATPVPLTIRLIGTPGLERDGEPVRPPRGRKAWAVLCYLALHGRPVRRHELAELLFGDADDPMGALRWTLAELRRATGNADAFRGDPVTIGIAADIDVLSIAHDDLGQLVEVQGDLLGGFSVDGCPVFESWLVVQQSRVAAAIEGRLRRAAVAMVAEGRFDEAVAFASRAVSRNILDEGNHELLVRCLVAAGDHDGAARQAAVCEDILRRELGVEVSLALRSAARVPDSHDGSPNGHPSHGRSEVETLIEAGRAAVGAGAVDAGLDCLYSAVAKASTAADEQLHGRALVALGGALVHGVRGRDGEGAIVLHAASRAATAAGDVRTMSTACRELGFVDVQAGRRPTAAEWLERAAAAADDDENRAAVLGVQGMSASDTGRYAEAIELLQRSCEAAARCGDHRQQAWSSSILGRAHLLRGESTQAATALTRSIELVHAERWLAFLPWPIALQAELDLEMGRGETVMADLERGWALACRLGDPCWEGMTARMLAIASSQHGAIADAATWIDLARRRCDAVSDTYQWVKAYVLDASVGIALAAGDEVQAARFVEALASVAARGEMGDLVVRAHLHRWRMGDSAALGSARLLASDVDNPALHRMIDDAAGTQR